MAFLAHRGGLLCGNIAYRVSYGQTEEFRLRFFGLGGSSICFLIVLGVSGPTTRFRGPWGPVGSIRGLFGGSPDPEFD